MPIVLRYKIDTPADPFVRMTYSNAYVCYGCFGAGLAKALGPCRAGIDQKLAPQNAVLRINKLGEQKTNESVFISLFFLMNGGH